jgi:hypothetical protein
VLFVLLVCSGPPGQLNLRRRIALRSPLFERASVLFSCECWGLVVLGAATSRPMQAAQELHPMRTAAGSRCLLWTGLSIGSQTVFDVALQVQLLRELLVAVLAGVLFLSGLFLARLRAFSIVRSLSCSFRCALVVPFLYAFDFAFPRAFF